MTPFEGETTTAGYLPCPSGYGNHDGNRVSVGFKCKNGHRLKGQMRLECPCGWPSKPSKGLDACGQAPCPKCKWVLTNGGKVCRSCEAD